MSDEAIVAGSGSLRINDKMVEIKKLTVKQIMAIIDDEGFTKESSHAQLFDSMRKHMKVGTNLSPDEFLDMTPGQIKAIYDKFKEVNSAFFEVARAAKMDHLLTELLEAVVEDFGKSAVNLLKADTPTSSATVTPIS